MKFAKIRYQFLGVLKGALTAFFLLSSCIVFAGACDCDWDGSDGDNGWNSAANWHLPCLVKYILIFIYVKHTFYTMNVVN